MTAVDGGLCRQTGLRLHADIGDVEPLGIDLCPCHLFQDETVEVVVLHLPGNLYLLFTDERQQQLSTETLAQRIDAFVEHEHPRVVCQHDQLVLR